MVAMSRRESHVVIDPEKLLTQLNARALSAAQLADEANVSPTTLSALLHHGRPVSVRTARRITEALAKHPPIEGLVELLAKDVA